MNWRRSGGANRRTWISSKPERVAKEELFVIEGQIDEILPDGRFRVLLDNEQRIIAYTAGKMRRYRIRSVVGDRRSEEHTSELQSLMRISYDGFCLKKKQIHKINKPNDI